MADLGIRRARESELAAVGALTVDGYDSEGYLLRDDGTRDEGYAAWLADAARRSREAVLLVAVERDVLLGTVTWCPPGSANREVATLPHQGELRTLAVAPAARGRGVGGALVDRCLAEARSSDLTEVVLSSLPQMLPAHRLYATRGFVRRPELDWRPHPDVPLWVFSRPVGPASDASLE